MAIARAKRFVVGKSNRGRRMLSRKSCAREYVFVVNVPIFLEICSRVVVSPSFSETRRDVSFLILGMIKRHHQEASILFASIVIPFLFLLLRGYPPIIGNLTDRLNFSSFLLHQQQHQIHQVVSLLGHLQLGHQKAGLVRPGVESQAREGYGPQLLR